MEALVLVGHGSRLPYSKELLVKLAEKIKEKNIFPIVEIGIMEFNEPTIPQAIKNAIEQGAKKIIVVPVFLAHGIHTKKDIPKLLGLIE
ncbi:MAG: sirohydrochlorin nickelochelatase, partial [Methanocaldococcus sp.]